MWVCSVFSENITQLVFCCSLYILTVSTLATRIFREYQAKKSEHYAWRRSRARSRGSTSDMTRVFTETRNLRTQPFVVPDNTNRVGKAWEEWLEGIEREFRYFRITEAIDKKDAIIIYEGKEIARLEKSLQDPETADAFI